jgi:hypothetical protein
MSIVLVINLRDDPHVHHYNSVIRAHYLGVVFDKAPTYSDIENSTTNISQIPGVNKLLSSLSIITSDWCTATHRGNKLG